MCDKSLLRVEHYSFMCTEKNIWRGVQVPGLPIVFSLCDIFFMCHMTCLCATWLINVQHEFLTYGTWLIQVYGKISGAGCKHAACPLFYPCVTFCFCATWLVYVRHDSYMCDKNLYSCNMTPVSTRRRAKWSELSRAPQKFADRYKLPLPMLVLLPFQPCQVNQQGDDCIVSLPYPVRTLQVPSLPLRIYFVGLSLPLRIFPTSTALLQVDHVNLRETSTSFILPTQSDISRSLFLTLWNLRLMIFFPSTWYAKIPIVCELVLHNHFL